MTTPYTVQLGHGLGMIDETLSYLNLWQKGMTGTDLYRVALDSGQFPNISARRLRDSIVVGFSPRYLVNDGAPALLIKGLQDRVPARDLEQVLFLYTCRAHPVLRDFLGQVYWPAYAAGLETISNDDARAFIEEAVREGRTTTEWAETMQRRMASNLTGVCADFGLLESGRKRVRKILPYRLLDRPAIILAYDLHFTGLGDNSVVGHPDWTIFGLHRQDVINELRRLALPAGLIVQSAASATKIFWQYQTMEEVVDALARPEL
jgi:hypothetical protein